MRVKLITFFLFVVAGEHPAAMQHGEHGFASRVRAGPFWLTLLVATTVFIFCSRYCMITQSGLWQTMPR